MYGGTRWCVWHKAQIGWFIIIISPQKSHSDNANFTWILKQKDLLSRRTFSSTKHSCNESALISWQTTTPPILMHFAMTLIISYGSKNIAISTDPSIQTRQAAMVGANCWIKALASGFRHHRWLVPKPHPPPLVAVKQLIEPPPLLWSFPGHGWNNLCHGVHCMVLSHKENRKHCKENRCRWGQNFTSHWRAASLFGVRHEPFLWNFYGVQLEPWVFATWAEAHHSNAWTSAVLDSGNPPFLKDTENI